MSNQYRVKQEKKHKYIVEMSTAAGWIAVNHWSTKEDALREIAARIEDENFTTQYFDMAGNLIPAN